MKTSLPAAFLSGAISILLVSSLRAQTSESIAAPSTLDSIYTVEQAQRGADVMKKVCADCHIPLWFTGTFLSSWNGARVGYLYEVIRTTMPEDRPGSLTAREYVDVLAYIFELNGLPAGNRQLPESKHELDAFLIKQRTP